MLFEISLDILTPNSEKKIITDSGHIVSISTALNKELNDLRISPKTFAEIVLNFLEENTKIYSTYIHALPVKKGCKYYSRIIDIWINYSSEFKHLFLILINYDEISEVLILDPQIFEMAADKLLSYASSKDCMEVSMPYPYKFVVFETFNTFKKKFGTEFEGIIGKNEKYLIAMDKSSKALVWKIESTKLDYLKNFQSDKYIQQIS
ncbi:hypothetical protein DFR86_07685 [Acidianus sulfidivorans JP7]|uniref:Uncharacterized protein n=1 Tax=Acidianus sulfidivorans JP7 TaxID=619593 RepID=A0A2U9IN55_9CREN|nr:hypothetical protein [Acidianus sulfidivorans]AWR97441.1 hypothetical protein DFR86_07685 [Acidianus sulfidivorans JP7]